MKKIAILGSTGSIGTQTLEGVRNNPELHVVALAAGKSVEQMEQQIREFHPLIAGMWSEEAAADLRSRVADLHVKVVSGMDGLLEIATMPQSQVLVTAIVGMIGIRPTIAAIEAGKDIALANKETLVTAGHIIMPLAAKMGVKILPVDSEHSAIIQSLNGEPAGRIEKILLTASGGPFRGRTREQLQNIQVEDALKHPNWSMGRKITIDSSTLVNKGLEVMEVKWLFGVDLDQIQVIVHPQSIIHSAVQYVDGAVIAQLGTPDMKLPITFVGRNTMGIYFFHYPIMIIMNGLYILMLPALNNIWVLLGVSLVFVLVLGSLPVDLLYTGVLNLIAFILIKKDKTVRDERLEEEYDRQYDKYELLRRKKAIADLTETLDSESEQDGHVEKVNMDEDTPDHTSSDSHEGFSNVAGMELEIEEDNLDDIPDELIKGEEELSLEDLIQELEATTRKMDNKEP